VQSIAKEDSKAADLFGSYRRVSGRKALLQIGDVLGQFVATKAQVDQAFAQTRVLGFK
jgi:hypothetical protein